MALSACAHFALKPNIATASILLDNQLFGTGSAYMNGDDSNECLPYNYSDFNLDSDDQITFIVFMLKEVYISIFTLLCEPIVFAVDVRLL
jgi:hypothetical protein